MTGGSEPGPPTPACFVSPTSPHAQDTLQFLRLPAKPHKMAPFVPLVQDPLSWPPPHPRQLGVDHMQLEMPEKKWEPRLGLQLDSSPHPTSKKRHRVQAAKTMRPLTLDGHYLCQVGGVRGTGGG